MASGAVVLSCCLSSLSFHLTEEETMPKQADDLRTTADNYAAVHSATELEFGGSWGVLFLILWSHYILFYFWYESYDATIFDFLIITCILDISGPYSPINCVCNKKNDFSTFNRI